MIKMINTLDGDLPESELDIREEREAVPCGEAVTTKYFRGTRLVRQDCLIIVHADKIVATGKTGEVGK